MRGEALPPAEAAYVDAVCAVLRRLLGGDLVAVYLFGSAAYGGYRPGRSDLDLQGIVARRLTGVEKGALAARLDHGALPCPAKGMEFVLYRAQVAARPPEPPPFEINLNTGPAVAPWVAFSIDQEPASHWFTLDLAIGRETGVPVIGPPPPRLIGTIPRSAVLRAALAGLEWHRTEEPDLSNTVLNAARARRFALEGRWGSKDGAGEWEAAWGSFPVVGVAVEARRGAPVRLDGAEVEGYLAVVEADLERALASERGGRG